MEDWKPWDWMLSPSYAGLYQFVDPRYWENRWEKGNNPQLSEGEKDMADQEEKYIAFRVVVYNEDDGSVYFDDTVTAKNSTLAERHVLRRKLGEEVPDDAEVIVRPFV